MMNLAARLSTVFILLFGSAAAMGAGVHYTVRLRSAHEKVTAVTISLHLRAQTGQISRFELPEGETFGEAGPRIEVRGGRLLADQSQGRVLTVRATTPSLEILYRLPFDQRFGSAPNDQASAVHQAGLVIHTADALIVPVGCSQCQAKIALIGLPFGWTAMCGSNIPTTVMTLRDSLILAGPRYHMIETDVDGAPVKLFYPDSWGREAAAILSAGARIIRADRRFWHDKATRFNIGVLESDDDENFSGTGFQGGLALYLGSKVKRDDWIRLMAHESLHSWISRRIGGFPKTDPDSEAWLNEGFTEAYAARTLLESDLWTLDQFVADWNIALMRYGTSPVKNDPNSRIVIARQRDFDVNRLPYDRGRLLALLWDGLLRSRTRGLFGLDDVLRAQERAARRKSRFSTSSADVLLLQVARRLTGVDLSREFEEYVIQGNDIDLPPDAFGNCAEIKPHTQADFDRGFDLAATIRAHGILAGLEIGGPAERAGLHEGDRVRIDEVPTHDSRVILHYEAKTGEDPWRSVSYHPVGKGLVTFQQIELAPVSASSFAACKRTMLRP